MKGQITARRDWRGRLRGSGSWMARWTAAHTSTAALGAIFAVACLALPNFANMLNLSAIAFQYSIIGFLALGQLLVILTEGIDLSQGSLVALTSVVIATLMTKAGLPMVAAILGGVLASTLLGLVSGLLVSRTRIPAFIVTLGMLGIARGLALLVSDGKPISITHEVFGDLGRSKLWVIPVPLILWLAAASLLHYFLTQRRLGRHIYAVGGSAESARLSGVNVKNIKLFVYVMSGFLTGIAGVLWTSRLSSGSPIGGANYELESIAAVVVGGGSLFGGAGTAGGTVAGVLIFGVINSMLNMAGISPYWQGTIKGVLILAAVALSQLRRTDRTNLKGVARHASGSSVRTPEPPRHV